MGRKNSITEVKLTPEEIAELEALLHQEVNLPTIGGLKVKMSDCHGAPIYYSSGGVRFPRCSRCNQVVPEKKIRYRRLK